MNWSEMGRLERNRLSFLTDQSGPFLQDRPNIDSTRGASRTSYITIPANTGQSDCRARPMDGIRTCIHGMLEMTEAYWT